MSTASEVLGDAYINVLAETGKLESGLARARSMVTGFVQNIGKTLAVGIGGAIATAAGTGIASVWAWAKEEQSVKDLESSIQMLGGSVEDLMPRYEKIAAQIQQNTTIADDATRSMMAYAASLGAPVDRLDDLATVAIGLGARMNRSPQMAMMLLTRAMQSGRFDMFQRYGLPMDKNMSAQEKMNKVWAWGLQGFGKAVAMADTLTGRLTQLKNNLGDMLEALGKKITEKLHLKEIVDEISKRIYRMVQGFTEFLDRIKVFKMDITAIGDKFEQIIVRLIAMMMTLPEVGRQIKEWFSRDNLKSFASTLLDVFKGLGKALWETLKGVLLTLAPIFKGLGEVLVQVVRAGFDSVMDNAVTKMIDVLKWVPGAAPMIFGMKLARKGWQMIRPETRSMGDIMGEAEEETKRQFNENKNAVGNVWSEFWDTVVTGFKSTVSDAPKDILEYYGEMLKKVGDFVAGFSTTAPAPGTNSIAPPVGGPGEVAEEKVGGRFMGVAEWWKHMQDLAQGKDDLAAKQLEQQEKIAENTYQTNQGLNKILGLQGVFQ